MYRISRLSQEVLQELADIDSSSLCFKIQIGYFSNARLFLILPSKVLFVSQCQSHPGCYLARAYNRVLNGVRGDVAARGHVTMSRDILGCHNVCECVRVCCACQCALCACLCACACVCTCIVCVTMSMHVCMCVHVSMVHVCVCVTREADRAQRLAPWWFRGL